MTLKSEILNLSSEQLQILARHIAFGAKPTEIVKKFKLTKSMLVAVKEDPTFLTYLEKFREEKENAINGLVEDNLLDSMYSVLEFQTIQAIKDKLADPEDLKVSELTQLLNTLNGTIRRSRGENKSRQSSSDNSNGYIELVLPEGVRVDLSTENQQEILTNKLNQIVSVAGRSLDPVSSESIREKLETRLDVENSENSDEIVFMDAHDDIMLDEISQDIDWSKVNVSAHKAK